jgi:dTDP-4-dehydrorhamnose reductase
VQNDRVLILGGEGALAGRLRSYLRDPWPLGRSVVDITDAIEVGDAINHARPKTVINCAAVTGVDWAERNQEVTLQVNAIGAGIVAAACHAADVPLVHISTDYVFQGNDGPYSTSDIPYPVNAYGMSKHLGEQAVRALAPRHLIVRLGWLYGTEYEGCAPMMAYKNTYTQQVRVGHVKVAAQHRAYIWHDVAGTPTYMPEAAWHIARDAELPREGRATVHLAPDEPPASWYDLLVKDFPAIERSSVPRGMATRPRKGGLVPSTGWEMPSYQESLGKFLTELDVMGKHPDRGGVASDGR